eukprot:m.870577 g.870577  ORF g.870577 m.870577 type:complete len:64 (-) comp23567_c0_seq1:1022-1213(-)
MCDDGCNSHCVRLCSLEEPPPATWVQPGKLTGIAMIPESTDQLIFTTYIKRNFGIVAVVTCDV